MARGPLAVHVWRWNDERDDWDLIDHDVPTRDADRLIERLERSGTGFYDRAPDGTVPLRPDDPLRAEG